MAIGPCGKGEAGIVLTYDMDNREDRPLYEHLYRCIKSDIECGAISPDQKLPSKRAFSRHLGVSLITVEGAYTQLIAEGYVRAVERKGYYANAVAPARLRPAHPFAGNRPHRFSRQPALDAASSALSGSLVSCGGMAAGADSFAWPSGSEGRVSLVADFSSGAIAPGAFPYAAWAKSLRGALSEESEESLVGESGAAGSLRLRTVLASHLAQFRGMEVLPDQIVIGAGSQTLYQLIIQLLGRRRRFAVEDPGYTRLARIYESNDVSLAYIGMDEEGALVDQLRESEADVAHIMPSHQFPMGCVTSIARRYELLGWAAEEPGRFIVEDDYDCEFRLAGKPIPSLASIDAFGTVIYANTFAKTLGPAFRIGYMVLPEALAARFHEKLGFYSCTVSAIDQIALARFIEEGSYERHVNKMRTQYRGVRNGLISALRESAFGSRIRIAGEDAGLHFLLYVESERDEGALAHAALREGVRLAPLSDFCRVPAHEGQTPCFVMNYTGVDPHSVPAAIRGLERAFA